MEITEVRVFINEKSSDDKLKAYATITLEDAFVVRNLKIIEGTKGLFVAMPSRKIKESCKKCRAKNEVRNRFCSQCGAPFQAEVSHSDNVQHKDSEHRDIAHPITLEYREYLQNKVLEAYEAERAKA